MAFMTFHILERFFGLVGGELLVTAGLEPWNFMTFHSVGNGKSSQLTFTPSFSDG